MSKSIRKSRETLLWELISKVRSNLDINKIKKMAVCGLSQIFDPDRCMILEYDDNGHTLPIEKSSEYLKSKIDKSMVGVNLDKKYDFWNMTNSLLERYKKEKKNVIYIPNAAEYIQGSHLMGSKIEKYCIHSDFTTCVGISIFEKNKIKMFFTIKFKKEKMLTDDDVEFIKIYAEQIYVAIKQNQIIKRFENTSDKERMLKKVVNTIRSSFDTKTIIKTFVFEVGKYLKTSRTFFTKYDKKTDSFLTPDANAEYIGAAWKESFTNLGRDFSTAFAFFQKIIISSKKMLVIDDIEEFIKKYNLEGSKDCFNLRKNKVGTIILMPAIYKKEILGGYVFSRETPNSFTQEDINFVVYVSAQTAIALYHAEILKKAKIQAKNEALLRKIITKAAKTLDMNDMKKIAKDIGKAVKADRCYFLEFNPENLKAEPLSPQNEYLSSPDIKSMVGYNFSFLSCFNDASKSEKDIRIFDFEKIKEENLPQMQEVISHANNFNVKKGIGIPFSYMDKFFMILIIEYVNENVVVSGSDLEFLRFIAKQLEVAFNQIKLYQETKQVAEREMLLKNVVSAMAGTLDKGKIGRYITRLIGIKFDLDRCFIVEYDTDNDSIITIDKDSEYRKSNDVKSLVGYEFPEDNDKFFKNVIETFDSKSFFQAMKGYDINHVMEYLEEYSIKEGFQVKLSYGGTFWGVLVGHSSDENKMFSEQDRGLIKALAKHVGIALYQSKLYWKEKQAAEREKLLRDIITATRNSLNIKQVKKTIVNELLKILKADLVSIFEYDATADKFTITDESSEVLSVSNDTGFKGIDVNNSIFKYFTDIYRASKDIIYSDSEEFIERQGIQNTNEAKILTDMKLKSVLSIPILHRDTLLGVLILSYTEKHKITQEEIKFIKALSEQIAIALEQSRLFEKQKKDRQKEKLLNRIVSAVRRTIDINEMKKNIANYVGKYIKADKVILYQAQFFEKNDYIDEDSSEYTELKEIFYDSDILFNKKEFLFFNNIFSQEQEKMIIDFDNYIDDFQDIDEVFKQKIKNIGLKSIYIFPIKHHNNQIANLCILYKERVELTKEELDAIRYFDIHTGFAINQALTYKDLQLKIEQELLFREIVEAIRSSLDLQEIKQKIVEKLGKTLNADRCYLRAFDIESEMFLAPDVEYLSSSEIKSLKNVVPDQEGLRYFFDKVKNKEGIYPVEVTEDFIIEHNAENKALDRYFKQAEIKSDFAIPVWSKKGELVFLVLHYIHKSFHLSDSMKQFLVIISKHISLALEQSDLYSEVKHQAEREKTNRKVIEIIRSSLDINQILLNISKEILILFDVQRVFAGCINFVEMNVFVEVTSREEINQFSKDDMKNYNFIAKYWEGYLITQKSTKVIENMEDSDLPDEIKQAYLNLGIKSFILVPIKSQEEIWGSISLASYDNYRKWNKDEVIFLEGIVSQLDMAIRQAELYQFQKNTALKESTLRNIISEMKLTRNLKQAYKKLLKILLEIFDVDRALFLEYSVITSEDINVKYEYLKNRKSLSTVNIDFPKLCSEQFSNFINNFESFVVNDIFDCSCSKNCFKFFEKYKIKALMGIPLVKYNKENKLLGFVMLCCENPRIWTDKEIELINAISAAIVGVIWDISKFIEIEDLRNSFILTLAHDFQVPLIGEKLAIEFLLQNIPCENEQNRKILEEILDNNNIIISLLNKSVDIYNYDAGKKELLLETYDIDDILSHIVYIFKNDDKNNAEIDFVKSHQPILVRIDKQEIMKVLNTLIENAIEHTPKGDAVEIKYYSQNQRAIISIHNKGHAIPKETQEVIFKRYEMALAIERKIGAGTGLFLAKKIIEAHKGNIWFETSDEKGTTFYISLPQVR